MKEIERKFLVKSSILSLLPTLLSKKIQQGYISETDNSIVRVRTKGEKGFLTIKGSTLGITRSEFEYEIPFSDAVSLLQKFCPSAIDKERFEFKTDNHTWEIDVFHGKLEGLIVAEIELKSEEETFETPEWVDKEVSYDKRFYNSNLIHMSYSDLFTN